MSGTVKILDTVTALDGDADRTANVDGGGGAHRTAHFYVDVTALTRTTGSMVVSVRWNSTSGTATTIAISASITAAGIYRLVPTTGVFDKAWCAVPAPTSVLWDMTGTAATISAVAGSIYSIYGD
jgi:hypothetical protein